VLARVTPDVPVTTNFMGLFEPLDYWAWAAREDVVSHDAYPDPEDPVSHADAALACDLMRSLRGGQPWMLMEQAPSAVNWRPRNRPKRPGAMRRISLQAVARGADAIMYFQWRAARRGSERFHSAMLPHAGAGSRVHREIQALGAELQLLAPVVGAPVPAQVALLHAWDSWWGLEAPDHPSTQLRLADRIRDHYAPLWQANVPVDLRPPAGDLSAYRLVVVPNLYLLSAEAAAGLERYVAGGGHLLVSFFSGIVDPDDAVFPGGWPGPLGEVLGLSVEEHWPLAPGEELGLRGRDGTALGTASQWTEVVVPAGAQVEAELVGGDLPGAPAVTRHRHGAGTATYVATRPDPAAMAALLATARAEAGVQDPPAAAPPGVEVVRRGPALFLLNHTDEAVTVELPGGGTSLLDGRRHAGEVELAPGGAEVLGPAGA
jgi:beta-galactosidase